VQWAPTGSCRPAAISVTRLGLKVGLDLDVAVRVQRRVDAWKEGRVSPLAVGARGPVNTAGQNWPRASKPPGLDPVLRAVPADA